MQNGLTGAGPLVPGVALPTRARAKRKSRKPPARSRRTSGSRPSSKAAGQTCVVRSLPASILEARDCLPAQPASDLPVDAAPDIVIVTLVSAAEDPDGPTAADQQPVACSTDPAGGISDSETAAASTHAQLETLGVTPVAVVSDVVAASAVGRGRITAGRGLAAILSAGLVILGAWALQPGLNRTVHPRIAAAPTDAMPAPGGSPAGLQEAAQAIVSLQGTVNSSRPNEGWATPPTRVSPVDVPDQPLTPLLDSSETAPSTVAASGTVLPPVPGLVPLPPRRPTTLALRRTSPVPPKVSSAGSETAAAEEPVRADVNVWSPPREAGRYRLPWGVAQLGERSNDDTARGPQWTFAVER